ncbi:hypothetical protein AAE478_007360 [Parahypoxylon ruwenzoriense]
MEITAAAQNAGESNATAPPPFWGPLESQRLLATAMIVPTPSSGAYIWRSHIAEKSPLVQPTRHRNVLTAARRHVVADAQNWSEVMGDGEWVPHVRVSVLFVSPEPGGWDLQEYRRNTVAELILGGNRGSTLGLVMLGVIRVSKPKHLIGISAVRDRLGIDLVSSGRPA